MPSNPQDIGGLDQGRDSGPTDGGTVDGGSTDGGSTDGGGKDGGGKDGGLTDGGSTDGGLDGGEDPDGGTIERTCPEDLRDSCIFSVLSCAGSPSSIDTCVRDPRLGDVFAEYLSGVRVEFRENVEAGSVRLDFRPRNPAGDQCYRARAASLGEDPSEWEVQSAVSMLSYKVTLTDAEALIVCPGNVTEICSRSKFDSFFAWPNDFPDSCPDQDPVQDLCDFDTDCLGGSLCCRPDNNSPRQCLSDDFCMVNRPPEPCTLNSECGAGETCSKCRNTRRECVPDALAVDPNNALGCVPDGCSPGDGSCQDPFVCCTNGGSFKCSADFECDNPPDPNPVCSLADTQPCGNPTQNCCFVSQLNTFRCIDENASCRTNVCYTDTDCASNEECCSADVPANIAGTCQDACTTLNPPCSNNQDCTGRNDGSTFCCVYPGYAVGTCELDDGACQIVGCEQDATACDPTNQFCCAAAPLSSAVCTPDQTQCPPVP